MEYLYKYFYNVGHRTKKAKRYISVIFLEYAFKVLEKIAWRIIALSFNINMM